MQDKSKPNNYTESCIVNVADGWRERDVWYPGRPVWNASKESNHYTSESKVVLNAQESAEVIVAEK